MAPGLTWVSIVKTGARFSVALLSISIAALLGAQGNVQFEAASVKQTDRCTFQSSLGPERVMVNAPLSPILITAFGVSRDQIVGPSWLENDCYELIAKVPGGSTSSQIPVMLRDLLAKRFKLTTHMENRPRTVYALVVDKDGPKVKKTEKDSAPIGKTGGNRIIIGRKGGFLKGVMTMQVLTRSLSRQGYGPIIDATGLEGEYYIDLSWAPNSVDQGVPAAAGTSPDLFTAVRESLGLRLEQRKTPIEVLIVDHIERVPTAN
jgi:uncharacterized protein (TIGR03435 family)